MIERVVIAGGGTGGHLFPGIAVLQELRRREPQLDALFVGTATGIEARVVPALGEELRCLDVSPLKGQGPRGLLSGLFALPRAGAQALKVLRRFAPDLVLGVGGYAAGPVVAAAAAHGIPTALMEQNAHVGLTNRLLSRLVGRAYLSYESTLEHFPPGIASVVGNPVRREFVQAGRLAQMDPAALEMRARHILVIGGSQGAQVLNETVPDALAALDLRERGYKVLHQAGPVMRDQVEARYRELGVDAEVLPFIDDMAGAYRRAALVVARAGATTLAEVCAIGRPAVLIPYPHAADDHQWHNARALERAGAALALRQAELDAAKLSSALGDLLDAPQRRSAMGDAARALGRPDAAASIVDDLCAWLGCARAELDEPDGPDSPSGEQAGSADLLSGHGAQADRTRAARRSRVRRRSFAWDHGDRYFGHRSLALVE